MVAVLVVRNSSPVDHHHETKAKEVQKHPYLSIHLYLAEKSVCVVLITTSWSSVLKVVLVHETHADTHQEGVNVIPGLHEYFSIESGVSTGWVNTYWAVSVVLHYNNAKVDNIEDGKNYRVKDDCESESLGEVHPS